MKKSFSDKQIISIFHNAEVRAHPVNSAVNAAFYTWRKKFGGMEMPEVNSLKIIEKESDLPPEEAVYRSHAEIR